MASAPGEPLHLRDPEATSAGLRWDVTSAQVVDERGWPVATVRYEPPSALGRAVGSFVVSPEHGATAVGLDNTTSRFGTWDAASDAALAVAKAAGKARRLQAEQSAVRADLAATVKARQEAEQRAAEEAAERARREAEVVVDEAVNPDPEPTS